MYCFKQHFLNQEFFTNQESFIICAARADEFVLKNSSTRANALIYAGSDLMNFSVNDAVILSRIILIGCLMNDIYL